MIRTKECRYRMLKILIIGYGFAGRSLHHHCISKMRDMGWSNVINPGVVAIDNAQPRAGWGGSESDAWKSEVKY